MALDEPTYDHEAVITRLLSEQAQTRKILDNIRRTLSSDPQFEGLSGDAGVKAVLKKLHEEQDKVVSLEQELTRIQHNKKKR